MKFVNLLPITKPSHIASHTKIIRIKMKLLTTRNSSNANTRSSTMKKRIRNIQDTANRQSILRLPLTTMSIPPAMATKLRSKLTTGLSNYRKAKKVSIVSS